MKGAGYGLTLIVILLITNLMLYIYGIDFPANTWLNVGIQTIGGGSSSAPTGSQTGGLQSTAFVNQIITTLIWAIIIGGAAGIAPSLFFGSQFINWTIPVAMIVAFLIFFLTPMGNIIGATTEEGESDFCYTMREGVIMFGSEANDVCVTWEVHTLLAIFFGVLVLATFMNFIRGVEW